MRIRQPAVMAALVLSCAPAAAQDRAADWLKKPTPEDLLAVWPREALKTGRSGTAIIDCVATVHGGLRDCKVHEEKPERMGFGSAALALTPQFLMKPALKDGVPVESTVRIPIHFGGLPSPGSQPGSAVSTHLPWRQAPTYAQLLAAYPPKARAARLGGTAVLDCRIGKDGSLSHCHTIREEPRRHGFAAAAKSLAAHFVTPTATRDGKTIAGSLVHLNISFPSSALERDKPVIGRPEWIEIPAVRDVAAVIPDAAREAKVHKARVVMTCTVIAEGNVDSCDVKSEEPAGLGYGAAATMLSRYFRLAVWTDEGLPTVGGRVTIPVRFDLEAAMTEAAKALP